MKRTLIKYFLISLWCMCLASCGFHLRNQNILPANLRVLYLSSPKPYGEFTSQLRDTLETFNVVIVDHPQQARVTLHIIQSWLSHTTPSIGISNQARIYTFTHHVIFDLRNAKGKVISPAQTVTSSNTLTLNANQLLDTTDQARILANELQRENITKIINRLSSRRTREDLSQSAK